MYKNYWWQKMSGWYAFSDPPKKSVVIVWFYFGDWSQWVVFPRQLCLTVVPYWLCLLPQTWWRGHRPRRREGALPAYKGEVKSLTWTPDYKFYVSWNYILHTVYSIVYPLNCITKFSISNFRCNEFHSSVEQISDALNSSSVYQRYGKYTTAH